MSLLAFDLHNLSKSYLAGSTKVPVLKNINLKINAGEYVAIMGPSGSGKTTLMHLMGCLDFPSSGELSILGNDIAQLSDDQISLLRSKTMGFVFQHFHLLPSYDALANVALPMVYARSTDRWNKAQQLLKQVGLGHRLTHRPRMMSGGEQQRVAIARALANNPQIMLADEPTGALDQENGKRVMEEFSKFHSQGKTIILVTHDKAIAAHAQRVIEMVDGVVKSDGKI